MPNVWTLKFYTKQIIYIHTQYTQSTTIIGVNNVQWFYFCSMETIVEALFFQCIFFILVLKKWLTVFFFSVFVQRFFFSSLSWHWQCFFSLVSGNASSSSSSPLATFLSSPLWCKLCLFLVLMKWLFFLNNKRCFFDLYSVHRRHFKWNRIHFVLNRVVKCSKPSFLSICFLLSKIFTTAMCQRHTRMPLYTRLIIGLI